MNGVMFQAFHWYLHLEIPNSNGKNLWQFLKDEADHYRNIGIDSLWIPPACTTLNVYSVGYDTYDHFNIGEFPILNRLNTGTKYGTKSELKAAISSLHGDGTNKSIRVYADVVLNHKAGGDIDDYWQAIRVEPEDRNAERWGEGFEQGLIEVKAYTKFDYNERNNLYSGFKWSARHFDSVDSVYEIRQGDNVFGSDSRRYIYRFLYNELNYHPNVKNFEKWVSLEKGNYDYLTNCDFDYGRYDVREEMKYWGEWFVKELDLDGVRLDAVKHISSGFIREWLGHVRWKTGKNDLFAVAEYISGETSLMHQYIKEVTATGDFPQPVTLFDFPLYFKLRAAGQNGESYDLRNLDSGTLMAEQPSLAVTFVENHDYEYGREFNSHVEEWFKPLAYGFILLRSKGYPCIFFPDYYGSPDLYEHKGYKRGKDYLDLLLRLRKEFALGEERIYWNYNVAGWIRMGFVPGAKGAMAVVMNTSYGKVKSIRMNTGRFNKSFYHLATIKWAPKGFVVARGSYFMYGDKAERTWTNGSGEADFLADGGSISVWIEDGVGLS